MAVIISGAAPNALVTLTYSYNGGASQVWNAGYTDNTGYWTVTGYSPDYQIGLWNEQWAVGGTNIGPSFYFEIVDQPAGLTVLSTGASSPTFCASPYVYGSSGSWKYQIFGTVGNESVLSTGLGISMIPQEDVTFYSVYTGAFLSHKYGNIGGDPPFAWSPPSASAAAANGIFYDVSLRILRKLSLFERPIVIPIYLYRNRQ